MASLTAVNKAAEFFPVEQRARDRGVPMCDVIRLLASSEIPR